MQRWFCCSGSLHAQMRRQAVVIVDSRRRIGGRNGRVLRTERKPRPVESPARRQLGFAQWRSRVSGKKNTIIRERLYYSQNRKCHYCRRDMTLACGKDLTVTVDHKIPASVGGTRDPCNVVGACWQCNTMRGDLAYDKFYASAAWVNESVLPIHGECLKNPREVLVRKQTKEQRRAHARAASIPRELLNTPREILYQFSVNSVSSTKEE